MVVAVVLLAAATAAAIATRTDASSKGALARLSNQGRHISIKPGSIVIRRSSFTSE